jgi:hypothetical protein
MMLPFNKPRILWAAFGIAWLTFSGGLANSSEADITQHRDTLPGSWGVNVHTPFNGNAMVSIGAQWVRLSLRWANIEKGAVGQYDWPATERLLSHYLDDNHLHVVCILAIDQVNPLYADSVADKVRVSRAIADWMAATAKHFKGRGIIWEIGNEPEAFPMGNYWNDPVTYSKMARLSAQAIKRADPSSKTAALSLAWMDRAFASSALDAGLLDDGNVDYLSFHGYHRSSIAPESGLAEDVAWLRSKALSATPKGLQPPVVIDTETGYALAPFESPKDIHNWRIIVYTEEAQAAYLARHFIEEIALGIPISLWYKDMYGESGYSLYYADASSPLGLRPMGRAFRTLAWLFPSNPGSMLNDRYDVSIESEAPITSGRDTTAPNPELFLRSFLRSDNGNGRTLIIAVWNSVEAFEGKILASRTFTATQCLERWRPVSSADLVNIPSQVTIANLAKTSIGVVQVMSLPDGDSRQNTAATRPVSSIDGTGTKLAVMVSPMPTIILVPLNAER